MSAASPISRSTGDAVLRRAGRRFGPFQQAQRVLSLLLQPALRSLERLGTDEVAHRRPVHGRHLQPAAPRHQRQRLFVYQCKELKHFAFIPLSIHPVHGWRWRLFFLERLIQDLFHALFHFFSFRDAHIRSNWIRYSRARTSYQVTRAHWQWLAGYLVLTKLIPRSNDVLP